MSKAHNHRDNKLKRLIEVEKMLGLGFSSQEVQARISEKWGVGDRTVRNDVTAIREKWAEEAKDEAPRRRHQYRLMFMNTYRKAMEARQYNAARGCVKDLCWLDGMGQVNVNHTGEVTQKVQAMTSDDKRRELQRLLDKAATYQPSESHAKH